MTKFKKVQYSTAKKQEDGLKWKPTLWTRESTNKSYIEWIMEQNPEKDPAEKFKYNDMIINVPPQAECCKNLREIDYDEEDTGITWVRLGYCQECREYGLKLLNYKLQKFRYRKSNEGAEPAS